MKNENYILIQGWQVNRLHLSGNELLLYALIYGFSQDGETEFSGSLSYMSEAIGVSRRNIIAILRRLVAKQLLTKRTYNVNGVKANRYVANITGSVESSEEVVTNHQRGSDESSPIYYNNKINNKIESNNKAQGAEFPDDRESKQGACPFRDAEFSELWAKLLTQPKWRGKTLLAVQLSARKLAVYDREFAKMLILEAIERNYQGLVFDSTPSRYARWINDRNRGALKAPPATSYRQILQAFDPLTATDKDFEVYNNAFNALDGKTDNDREAYWQKYGDYMDNLMKIK